jgi:hypothetical protein
LRNAAQRRSWTFYETVNVEWEKMGKVNRFARFGQPLSRLSMILLVILVGCAGQPQLQIPAQDPGATDDGPTPERPANAVRVIKGKRPDWVNTESKHYPPDRFLTAVGYGSDRPAAEDKARAEIAKIFYSDIHSSNSTYQEILETSTDGKTHTRESINFEEITRVSTRRVLSGIRIAEVYQESGPDPQFYALAALDRYQTEKVLQHKIEELDRDIQNLYLETQRQQDKLGQVQNLQLCIRKYILRQAYDTELRIVSPSGRGIPQTVSFMEIENRLKEVLLRDFFIAITIKGIRADEIQRTLVEALNQKGFSISEEIQKTSVLVRGTIQIEPIEQDLSEWKFVRWKAYFDLLDRQDGAVFGSVQKSGKAGHLSQAQAEERAIRKMQTILAEEISEDLIKYILRLSTPAS